MKLITRKEDLKHIAILFFFCVIYGVLYVDVLYYVLMKILAKEEKFSHTFRYFGALVFKYSKGFVVIHGRDIGGKVARNIKGDGITFLSRLNVSRSTPQRKFITFNFSRFFFLSHGWEVWYFLAIFIPVAGKELLSTQWRWRPIKWIFSVMHEGEVSNALIDDVVWHIDKNGRKIKKNKR